MSSGITFNALDEASWIDDKVEHLSDSPQKESIEAIQKLAGETILSSSPKDAKEISFEARPLAKKEEPLLSDEEFAEGMENLSQAVKEFHGVENIDPPQDVNFIIRVRNLVSRILEQLGRSTDEKDRAQIEEMKRNYRLSTKEEADFIQKIGNTGFTFSAIAVGCMLGQFLPIFSTIEDRKIMQFISEQCPQFGRMFTGRYEAQQREANALAQLILNEYSAKTSKTQSEAGSKQEVLQLLQSVLETLKRASSAQ